MSSARLRSSTRASTVASESLAETISEIKAKGDTGRRTNAASKPIRAQELNRLLRFAYFAFVMSNIVIGAVYYASINDMIRLSPTGIKLEALKGFNSRAEYSLRYQCLLYSWLMFCVLSTIYARFSKKALDPLKDSTEKYVQKYKNILTNSFEQTVISSFLQLAFVSFADPTSTMKLIPAVNITQFFGRIAFFIGYPYYRTFGYNLTMVPNLLMVAFNLYKLGSYLGLYAAN